MPLYKQPWLSGILILPVFKRPILLCFQFIWYRFDFRTLVKRILDSRECSSNWKQLPIYYFLLCGQGWISTCEWLAGIKTMIAINMIMQGSSTANQDQGELRAGWWRGNYGNNKLKIVKDGQFSKLKKLMWLWGRRWLLSRIKEDSGQGDEVAIMGHSSKLL